MRGINTCQVLQGAYWRTERGSWKTPTFGRLNLLRLKATRRAGLERTKLGCSPIVSLCQVKVVACMLLKIGKDFNNVRVRPASEPVRPVARSKTYPFFPFDGMRVDKSSRVLIEVVRGSENN